MFTKKSISTNNTNNQEEEIAMDVEYCDPFALQPDYKKKEDDVVEEKKEENEMVEDDAEVVEIENILEYDGESKFLIKWVGKKKPTWIERDAFIEKDMLNEFESYEKNRNNEKLEKRAYIYCRTSKRNSDREVSLFDQEKYCLDFAKRNKINIVGVFRDNGLSAKDMKNQHSLNLICNKIKKGECILFYDISRFSRNMAQAVGCLEKIQKVGAIAHSCSEGLTWNHVPTSRNLFRQNLSTAQLHSEIIAEKVKSSIAFRRERGDHMGYIPYGYKTEMVDGRRQLVRNETEVKIADLIVKEGVNVVADKLGKMTIRSKGKVTKTPKGGITKEKKASSKLTPVQYRKIAENINKHHKNRGDKPFTWQAIRKIHDNQ